MSKKLIYIFLFCIYSCETPKNNEVNDSIEIQQKVEHSEIKDGVLKEYNELNALMKVDLYYNDSLLFNLDLDDYDFVDKKLSNKMTISVPEKWQTSDLEYGDLAIVKSCSEIFCPNFTITKEKVNDRFDLYLDKNIGLLSKQFNVFKLIAQGGKKINTLESYQITYLMEVDNVRLGGITTWVKKDEVIYILTGMAINEKNSEFLKYKVLFQEIVESFRSI